MTEEDAFIRAIQADPADVPTRLVYADWLAERGEAARAGYLRGWVGRDKDERPAQRVDDEVALTHSAWGDLIHGRVALWDAPTTLALGRIEGLLRGYASLNLHRSDIAYDFGASLRRRTGTLVEQVQAEFDHKLRPVSMEPLEDWEGDIRAALARWLFDSLGQIPAGAVRLAFQDEDLRGDLVAQVMHFLRDLLRPHAGWRLRITEGCWYGIGWDDFVLEAEDRLLFLHFSFSD